MKAFLIATVTLLVLANCQVPHEDEVQVPLVDGYGPYPYYSGYLNISRNKAFHYVFFTSQHDRDNDPVLLWLNGGPGCSSLIGMVYQNGPFKFDPNSTHLKLNPYSWNLKANLLYLESPGSVGFSIGPAESSDESAAEDNLRAMEEFYNKFPAFRKNELYLSGQSYAGIYVPWLALRILENNNRSTSVLPINLKGTIIGNACTDPMECYFPGTSGTSLYQFEFLYKHGFYTEHEYSEILSACSLGFQSTFCFETRSRMDVKFEQTYTQINNIYAPCWFQAIQDQQYHFRQNHKRSVERLGGVSCGDSLGAMKLFNDGLIRERLHLGGFHSEWDLCSSSVEARYKSDERASYWIYPLLIKAGLRVWVYSGDVDANVPITGTISWVMKLRQEFSIPVMEPWREWWVNKLHKYEDFVGGMIWKLKNMTIVSVKGAGQ